MKKFFLYIFFLLSISPNLMTLEISESENFLNQFYKNKSGFGIGSDESNFIYQNGGDPTYGEIKYEAVKKLIEDLKINKKDVFYDLGSGVGKVVVQVYLETKAKKSIGIELSKKRHNQAEEVKKELQEKGLIDPKRNLTFLNKSFLDHNFKDATIVYLCSTCFSDKLMSDVTEKLSKAKKIRFIVTLKELPENEWFKFSHKLDLPMTWSSSSNVYIYVRR